MAEPTNQVRPFVEGVRRAVSRGQLPTSMASREIAIRLDGELKRSAVFSARVENARVVQKIRDSVAEVIAGVTEARAAARAAGEAPVLKSIADAKADLLDVLDQEAYEPHPDDVGTIKDLRSDKRLSLILETQEQLIQGHGRWTAGQDPDLLDAYPAWELVRISPSLEPRNWPTRWMMAGGRLYGGRMIALKGANVWDALGDPRLFPDALGNPYPPFAFNSGMDVREITRRECERLGVMPRGAAAPQPDRRTLTEGMQVSADRFDALVAQALEEGMTIEDGVLKPL